MKYNKILPQLLESLQISKNIKRNTQITIMRMGQRRVKKSHENPVKDTAWKVRKGFIKEVPLKNRWEDLNRLR